MPDPATPITINTRMSFRVFVDTNVFVALRDLNDSTHQEAVKLSANLLKRKVEWFTSSDVIGETLTVMSRKLGRQVAVDWYQDFKKGGIKEIFVDDFPHKTARRFFGKVKSKTISFVDCSSVVVMKKNKIDAIFSFDEDFRKMGVKLLGDLVKKNAAGVR